MKIGLLAPPWVAVPPVGYGGTEAVVDQLARGFRADGHDVLLWTTGESTCPVDRAHVYDRVEPELMGTCSIEIRHVLEGYQAMIDWEADVVHDHSLVGPILSAQYPGLPVVTTNHGPFTSDLSTLYRSVTPRVALIAISENQARSAPEGIAVTTVIHHGLDVDLYQPTIDYERRRDADPYYLFLGRMAADKGVVEAIEAVEAVNGRLVIAAKMREEGEKRYFARSVEPLLNDRIRYIGEADQATKRALLSRAVALINPIRWPEPFGLVMIEALACGTPVIASPLGAAPEIVDQDITGFLCTNHDERVSALGQLSDIDRRHCRAAAEERFSTARMVADHLDLFTQLVDPTTSRRASDPDAVLTLGA